MAGENSRHRQPAKRTKALSIQPRLRLIDVRRDYPPISHVNNYLSFLI